MTPCPKIAVINGKIFANIVIGSELNLDLDNCNLNTWQHTFKIFSKYSIQV